MTPFEYDYFISFANADNQPIKQGSKGWVTNFHKFLEILLTQLLGQRPSVLFYANGEKPSEAQIAKCARMVVVLSPDYADSNSSIEDIESFVSMVEKQAMAGMQLRDRLFKVVKLPVPFDQEPSRLRDLIGYDLFLTNHTTGQISEIQEFFNEEAEKAYWMKLAELAFEIYQSIQTMNSRQTEKKEGAVTTKGLVYLADSGFDMATQRAIIKRDLLRHGFKVLPESTLPSNQKEMEGRINADLAKCTLSIHLIGDSYGYVPKGVKKSVMHLQNDLAAEHARMAAINEDDKVFRRLIWISPALRLTDEKQRQFVENVKRDMEALVNAEILQTPLEDFKSVIRHGLLDLANNATKMTDSKVTKKRKGGPLIYLIFDKADESEVVFLRKFLEDQGMEVIPSEFNKPFMELRTAHINNLKICDGALIFKNKVNDKWVQMKALDLLKAPGLGRNKEIAFRGIYKAFGADIAIAEIKNLNVRIVEEPAGEAPDVLIPYIQQLRTNQ